MSLLRVTIVKVKKSHLCFSCHRRFNAGTEMENWANIYEGEFCTGYTCLTCVEIHKTVPHEWIEEGIPDGFVNESLNKGESPEQYLERLKTEITQ